jgi:ABC-type nitrate/sulfonate/bicarbonate transport system permease component
VVGEPRAWLKDSAITAFGFAILFVGWHVISQYVVSSVLFPPPLPVLKRAGEMAMDGSLFVQIWASLRRILVGFVLGSAAGVVIGLLMGSFRPLRRLFDPAVETLRFIPAVAMITVAVIWFGLGEASKYFIIFYSTLFIVIITTAAGVSGIPQNKFRAGQVLGASHWQIFVFVTFPASMPMILTGMRVAMSNAFTTIVAAEMVAANQGIGAMLWKSRLYMLVDNVFVALLTLAALGFAIDRLFRTAIKFFAGRYFPLN